jgi:hypothetical protein
LKPHRAGRQPIPGGAHGTRELAVTGDISAAAELMGELLQKAVA